METLAIGISLICVLYIFLFIVLNYWLGRREEGRWSGTIRSTKEGFRRLFSSRLSNKPRNFSS